MESRDIEGKLDELTKEVAKVREVEKEVIRVRGEIETKLAVLAANQAANTRWLLFFGAVFLAALGYTNFQAIPKEANDAAIRAVKEKVGPKVLDELERLLVSMKKSKEKADSLVSQIELISNIQVGSEKVGSSHSSSLLQKTIKFPREFLREPIVLAVARGGNYPDTFSVTSRAVSKVGFSINVVRTDTATPMGWDQGGLAVEWIAIERKASPPN